MSHCKIAVWKIELWKQYLRRVGLDLLLIPLAFYLAWWARFDFWVPRQEWLLLLAGLLPIVTVYIISNLIFGIYRHLWAFASFRDVVLLSEAVGLATTILVIINFALGYRLHTRLSTGGLVMGGLLTLTLSTTVKYRHQLLTIMRAPWTRAVGPPPERVLIVGINETAQQLAAQIYLGQGQANYQLAGYIDDNPKNIGMNLNGVAIIGTPEQIPSLVSREQIDIIFLAQPSTNREQLWSLISACRETTAQVKVLPTMVEVIEDRFQNPLTLHGLKVEEILGRSPTTVNFKSCHQILAGKVVLVTGAAGSIGSELCRQILEFEPRLLLALDNNETGLYELELELNRTKQLPLRVVMANVGDWQRMNSIFRQHQPQVVFHAAAYKHVPLVEGHPVEALKVNILGTIITSEAAHRYQAERFVFISTDKAVKPSSLMGASKHIGEMWLRSVAEHSHTVFSAVRFGNVIGSRGSVLPTFTRQIELGGPVTVTHPEMARFFMSIPEAVRLVLDAATFSRSGEIFMLEMGQEISILELAQRLIRLKGLRIDKDIRIEFVGIRPGEKLHETLAYDSEIKKATPHPRIYSLYNPDPPLDRDTLLGAITVLSQTLELPDGEKYLANRIFQIAGHDVDAFLKHVTGLDFKQGRRLAPQKRAAKLKQPLVMTIR